MRKYKYFANVIENAVFTDNPCQFCGSHEECLEGIYFEQKEIQSVCITCFNTKKIEVYVPEYIQKRIKKNKKMKVNTLKHTPPIPWIQNNDWQVCCDDFMQFQGEWDRNRFILEATDGNGVNLFGSLLCNNELTDIDYIEALWDDIGYDTATYVFSCSKCGKKIVVCQSY